MIRIEGIPIVAARLASAQKSAAPRRQARKRVSPRGSVASAER
jgi:hypothetical protein